MLQQCSPLPLFLRHYTQSESKPMWSEYYSLTVRVYAADRYNGVIKYTYFSFLHLSESIFTVFFRRFTICLFCRLCDLEWELLDKSHPSMALPKHMIMSFCWLHVKVPKCMRGCKEEMNGGGEQEMRRMQRKGGERRQREKEQCPRCHCPVCQLPGGGRTKQTGGLWHIKCLSHLL